MSKKVTVIGAGSVGSTIAYTLSVMGIADEIVMIDINENKVLGEALDIRQQVSRFFSEFMDGRQELEIVLENVFDDDWELLLDVYKKVDHPNFKLCLDIGHAHCYSSVDVREWAKALAPYVTHVHVHDNLGDRDAHTGLGRGNLPYQQVLENLPLTEERTWTIECMKKEDAQLCWEKIRALEGGAL